MCRHASSFAKDCAFDLKRKPRVNSLWVDLLKGKRTPQRPYPSAQHHFRHLLCRSPGRVGRDTVRGTAPATDDGCPAPPGHLRSQSIPRPGLLLMWESWLRHEVVPGTARGERLSISVSTSPDAAPDDHRIAGRGQVHTCRRNGAAHGAAAEFISITNIGVPAGSNRPKSNGWSNFAS